MTLYTSPHSLPILEINDKIASSADGLRHDLNDLARASQAAVTAEGIRVESAVKADATTKYGTLPARVTVVESKNTAQDVRLNTAEAKNVAQDVTLTNHESRVGSLETLGGLAPGAVSDATVTSLVANPDSTTIAELRGKFAGKGEFVLNVADYPSVADALAAAMVTGRRLLVEGTYALTDPLLSIHKVRYEGSGSFTFGGQTFYVKPYALQRNKLYVSPAGADANHGLAATAPMKTLQAAFDAIANYGSNVGGRWEINLAAGTYPALTVSALTTSTVNQVVLQGPVAGHPNVPTAILDGAGGAAYSHGITATGNGVKLYVKDVKFINFTAGAGDTTRIGLNAEAASNLQTSNVHATGCTWTGIYGFNAENVRLFGGIFDGNRSGIVLNASHGTVGRSVEPVIIRNSTESGLYWSRGSQGHADYMVFEDNTTALSADQNSRVHVTSSSFKRNSTAIEASTGATFTESGNTYNIGTADANSVIVKNFAFSGSSNETIGAYTEIRVAADRLERTVPATAGTYQTMVTPYTLTAGRLTGPGTSLRVKVTGYYATLTAGAYLRFRVGALILPLAFPASGADNYFEAEFVLNKTPTGHMSIARLNQSTQGPRFNKNVGEGFSVGSSQQINVDALITSAADVVKILTTDVYITG